MRNSLKKIEKQGYEWFENKTPLKILISWLIFIPFIYYIFTEFILYQTPTLTNTWCYKSDDTLIYREQSMLKNGFVKPLFLGGYCVKMDEGVEIKFVKTRSEDNTIFQLELENGNTVWGIAEDIKGIENINDLIK